MGVVLRPNPFKYSFTGLYGLSFAISTMQSIASSLLIFFPCCATFKYHRSKELAPSHITASLPVPNCICCVYSLYLKDSILVREIDLNCCKNSFACIGCKRSTVTTISLDGSTGSTNFTTLGI